jgi:hypothetical protein
LYLFTILFLLLIPALSNAQIVTASFDRTTLSINPASATTRNFSQLAVFSNFRNTKSQASQAEFNTFKLEEDIKITKFGIYFTGHGRFAPELYLSKDAAEKTFDDGGTDQKQKSKTDLMNNFVNVGLLMTRNFSLGLKLYGPKYEFKEKVTINFPDTTSQVVNTNMESSITGTGLGFTYNYKPQLYFGGYYTKIKVKNDFNTTVTDSNGTTNQNDVMTTSLSQMGFGLSYLRGGIGRGLRGEIAYSRMEQPKEFDADAGEEIQLSADYSHNAITFGGNIKLRKNAYFDHIELIDYVIGERVFNESYEPAFGGYFSYGAGKGHSVGVSGFVYSTTGTRNFYGIKQEAIIKIKQIAFNYAYLF